MLNANVVREVLADHRTFMKAREKQLEADGIKIFRLSTTERSEFKDCRRKWDFGSLSRQGIEAKRTHAALSFGTAIHHGLEMFYASTIETDENAFCKEYTPQEHFKYNWYQNAIRVMLSLKKSEPNELQKQAVAENTLPLEKVEELTLNLKESCVDADFKKEVDELAALGVSMLDTYETWSALADNKADIGFQKVIHTEYEFAVTIPNPNDGTPSRFTDGNGQVWEMWLVGRLDMIVLDWDGRLWVLDHKTSKDKLQEEILVLDDQMTKYMWALQTILSRAHIDEKVEGCYYNVLRKKLPRVPEPLKSGKGLSKAKTIDTTYEVYYEAVVENGFDPADYEEILNILQNKKDTFVQREKVRRNSHELASAGIQLFMEGIDMLNAPYIYPNFTWDCRWKCDYKELCHAMERNDDVEWMREALFQKRQKEEDSFYSRESTIE